MKKRSFYSFMLAGVMMFAAVLFPGCTEDLSVGVTGSPIIIDVSYPVFDGENPSYRTRGTEDNQTTNVCILTSRSGRKLFIGVSEAAWEIEEPVKTRGTKISTAGINPFGVSASVCESSASYTSVGCGSYFYNIEAATGIALPYYWPTSSYKLSTFAYYPYSNAAFTLQSSASSTGAPTYAYTVPSAIGNQLDVMTGQDVNHLGGGSSPISMTMKHRCAAVNFSVTNSRSDAITVNSISIEGVKYSGTLNEETWTLNAAVNSSSSNPFILTPNASVSAGATANITGTSNVFLMLPQTIPAGAKLKVVVDSEEFEGSLTGEWQAGKNYVYSITMNESWEYILSVSGPAAYSYTGGTNTYTIQSYRSKSEGLITENIAWTATYDTNGDGIYNDSQPAWLTAFTASGSGSTSATAYNATLSAQSAVIGTASDTYAARSCSVMITQSDSGESQTFTIAQNAFTDTYTYYLTVAAPAAYTYAGGTNSYSVTSYKQNANRTTVIPWTANITAGTTPAWIAAFTSSGSGSSSATAYNCTVAAQSAVIGTASDTYAARSQVVTFSQSEGTKTANFTITQNAFTDTYTYYLTVTGPADYPYNGGTKSYSVTSYKQNTARTTAVAWTATYSTNSGSSYSGTKPSWITAFTGTAAGGSSASAYNATVAAQTPTSSATQDVYAARSCRVKISQNEGSLNRTFDINQTANTVNYTVPDPVSVGDWTAQ